MGIIWGVLLFTAAQPVERADISEGNGLYDRCKEGADFDDTMTCYGYLAGILDGMDTVITLRKGVEKMHCMPGGVRRGQIKDVVTGYLRDNPQHRNLPSSYLILGAVRKAWPCPAS